MSAFRDRSWEQRVGVLGDEAEQKFAEFAEEEGFGFAPYGLARPPVNLSRVSPFVRYTPDFLTANRLIEVQGHGREGVTKCKIDKLQQLSEWDRYMPVAMFLWNSTRKVRFLVPFPSYWEALHDTIRLTGAFDDGRNPWYGVYDSVFDHYQV